MDMVDTPESMLASIGRVIAPLFTPSGWGDWQSAVAAITGLVAKENVVGAFGVLFGFAEVAEDGMEVWASLQGNIYSLVCLLFPHIQPALCSLFCCHRRHSQGNGQRQTDLVRHWLSNGFWLMQYPLLFTVSASSLPAEGLHLPRLWLLSWP